jgi:hypothetical protein
MHFIPEGVRFKVGLYGNTLSQNNVEWKWKVEAKVEEVERL